MVTEPPGNNHPPTPPDLSAAFGGFLEQLTVVAATTWIRDAVTASLGGALERLAVLAKTDPELRGRLRELGKALLGIAAEPAPTAPVNLPPPPPSPAPAPPREERPAPPPVHIPRLPERATPLPPEPPAAPPAPPAPAWTLRPVSPEDLVVIEERCRLKAEGVRWAAERRRLIRDGADFAIAIEPKDRDIIERARRLPDCFLWMCHRDAPVPADWSLYDQLAGCFDAAASAVALLNAIAQSPEGQDVIAQALDLAAEAQSALRVAIVNLDARPDGDQIKIFAYLRATGSERQIFIPRFMRVDDPADPAGWADLQERIAQLDAALQAGRERGKKQRKQIGKARYHLGRITNHPGPEIAADWERVVAIVDELVSDGVPPSNREIRDLLLPVLDDLPEDLGTTRNFQLVLREIDRFLSSRPEPAEAGTAAPLSEAVRKAAGLLRGRAMLLIGGERRPHAAEALTEALGLTELIWMEGREQSYAAFEPHVARPDVAVVILAIRWSSHGFGEVKEFCDKYGKPLVRLPAGYNPNQVAYHILTQVGDRLGC